MRICRYRIIVVFWNMNVKFENDRKHCALQISRKDFGAWLSRHGASLIRGRKIGGQFWKFGNLICSNHLWVLCLIHINTFVDIRRHAHTTLQQVSPKIKTKRVCYNLPAVLAFVVHFYPPFCRPFRCWQSCHGYENCWLFSSLFVKIDFFSRSPRFNNSLLW